MYAVQESTTKKGYQKVLKSSSRSFQNLPKFCWTKRERTGKTNEERKGHRLRKNKLKFLVMASRHSL